MRGITQVTWSDLFTDTPDPFAFDSTLNQDEWITKNLSVSSSAELDRFLNTVVARITEELGRITGQASIDFATVRQAIARDYNALSYQDKFQEIVKVGRQWLDDSRRRSVDNADFNGFFQQFYFYNLTPQQRDEVKQYFLSQDYGFGVESQRNEKQSAMNRAINAGLIQADSTLNDFERLVNPANKNELITKLKSVNGLSDRAIIDPAVIESNPYGAAGALVDLYEKNKLTKNEQGTYQWATGASWRDLQSYDNGSTLNAYQKLVLDYESSTARDEGQTFSQYLAIQNREAYSQLSQDIRRKNQQVNQSATGLNEARAFVENAIRNDLNPKIQSVGQAGGTAQAKIDILRDDAFRLASNKLAQQELLTNKTDSTALFNELNSIYQDMAGDLLVKNDFFNFNTLNSNINYNWQNWFERELRSRYDPSNPNNAIKSLLGDKEEDARLAAQFVQEFLQKRFDASKSLSEFTSYIDLTAPNAVLEKDYESSWTRFQANQFDTSPQSFANPATFAGNIWTRLQNIWSRGRSFDANYYLSQNLGADPANAFRVSDLHHNIKQVHGVALSKKTSQLSANDLKGLNLKGINSNSDQELQRLAQSYRQWFEIAYENGVDITNEEQFAQLHYSTYEKNSVNPILYRQNNTSLLINDPNLISESERKLMEREINFLEQDAKQYAERLRFGEFVSPEEYISQMFNNSTLFGGEESGIDDEQRQQLMKDFASQYTGIVASYAGEVIREQIRNSLEAGKKPTQNQLGVDYIQRTKEQALSTIRSLINKDVYGDAVLIDNFPGVMPGESIRDWFSRLDLELLPGKSWDEFKQQRGLPASLSYQDWERSGGQTIDPETNMPLQDVFWNQWAQNNGINIITTGTATDPRMSLVIDQPTSSWLSWAKRITSNPTQYASNLEGAQVSIRSDRFNTDWYSKTNPYSKVTTDWNSIVAKSNQSIVDTNRKDLGQWAKESGLNPEQAWEQYRDEKQKQNINFGKDSSGRNMSYITWSQNVKATDINQFWSESASYWFNYLRDKKLIKGGTATAPVFKTWSEWATENGVELKRVNDVSSERPPDGFLELHYSVLGGKNRVDERYLDVYFPEYSKLAQTEIKSATALSNSPFDLSQFGFDDENSNEGLFSLTPITSTGRKSISPIDFALNQMFGDAFNSDNGDPFGDLNQDLDELKGFGLKLDSPYNNKKKTSFDLTDFEFGDFGGAAFGF